MTEFRLDIDPDIRRAETPPGRFYTEPEVFDRVRDRVFARTWQFVEGAEAAETPSSFAPATLLPGSLDESVVWTRDEAGDLRCISNVCTHRANRMVEAPGQGKNLRCAYHGRRFALDGSLQRCPGFEGALDFPRPVDHLAKVPHGSLGPMHFAAWRPELDFAAWTAPMAPILADLPLADARPDPERSREYEFDAHWALYCDNYLEGFHIPFIHESLNATLDFSDYRVELFPEATLQLAVAAPGESAFEKPLPTGQAVAAYYYWLYPATMVNIYPWGISLNAVQPLAPDRTRVLFRTYVWSEDLLDRGAGSDLHRVELEDEAVVTACQQGIRSRAYTRGRYSPIHETGTHHFHRRLARDLHRHRDPSVREP